MTPLKLAHEEIIDAVRILFKQVDFIEKDLYGSKSEMVREALRLLFEKYGVKIWE